MKRQKIEVFFDPLHSGSHSKLVPEYLVRLSNYHFKLQFTLTPAKNHSTPFVNFPFVIFSPKFSTESFSTQLFQLANLVT